MKVNPKTQNTFSNTGYSDSCSASVASSSVASSSVVSSSVASSPARAMHERTDEAIAGEIGGLSPADTRDSASCGMFSGADDLIHFPVDQSFTDYNDHSAASGTLVDTLALIDPRQCLRDSLASNLGQQLKSDILTFDSVDALLLSRPSTLNSVRIILLCVGAIDHLTIEKDIKEINNMCHDCSIVLFSDEVKLSPKHKALVTLLNGYIPSSYNSRQLSACLSVVEEGISFFPSGLMAEIDHDLSGSVYAHHHCNLDSLLSEPLTPRQQQVLDFVAQGKSNKAIASELSLKESTIKVYVSEVLRKLDVENRTQVCYLVGHTESDKTSIVA